MIWRQTYLKRLAADLDRWSRDGLVDPAKVPAILKAAEATRGPRALTGILAVLGVVLLGFAAMSFVAANWADMSKLAKLTVLGGGMWAAIGIALWRTGADARPPAPGSGAEPRGEAGGDVGGGFYTDAAVLLAVVLYGVAIMLIGQMYHVAGSYASGLLLWFAGALAAAWLVPSRTALALAIVLAPMWSVAVLMDAAPGAVSGGLHWPFLIALAPAALLAAGMGWRPGMHLTVLAFAVWCAVSAVWLMGEWGWPPAPMLAILTLIALGVFAKAHLGLRLIGPFDDALAHWGLFGAMAAAFWMPLAGGPDTAPAFFLMAGLVLAAAAAAMGAIAWRQGRLAGADLAAIGAAALVLLVFPYWRPVYGEAVDWLMVVAYFGAAVWCVSYGTRAHDRFAINLGFTAFGAMALYVYFQTVGTLLGTATFFAVGGLVLIALSVSLERLRRRLIARQAARAGDAA